MYPNLAHLYEATPVWLDVIMAATSLITVALLYVAIRQISIISATRFLIISAIWMMILLRMAHAHFFQQLDAVPPHFILVIGPPLLLLIGLLLTTNSRSWMDRLPLLTLTHLHTVRIPVELTLYMLYIHHQVPKLMTFEGRNVDILAGLTAPVVAYFAFRRKRISVRQLLIWNVFALGLVLNIVVHAILSAPLPLQQLAFEQPNVAMLKAPYIWLPGVIVPVVLFSHIVAIRQLIKKMSYQ